jgi:CRP-like cAMP-binding protein
VDTTTVELLDRHPLVARLAADQLLRFAQVGAVERYEAGEPIVVAGSLGDSMYLILSGAASVHSDRGGRPLATLAAGEFFGEMSLVEPAVRSATVQATEVTLVFRVPHAALASLTVDEPRLLNQILVQVVRALSQRLRHSNELIGSVEKLSEWLAHSLP